MYLNLLDSGGPLEWRQLGRGRAGPFPKEVRHCPSTDGHEAQRSQLDPARLRHGAADFL